MKRHVEEREEADSAEALLKYFGFRLGGNVSP